MVLGHEAAGVVTKLGSAVSNLKVCSILTGLDKFDKILVKGGRPSGYRARCSLWRLRLLQDWGKIILGSVKKTLHLVNMQVYNLCPAMQFCATPPVHGNLARCGTVLCSWITSSFIIITSQCSITSYPGRIVRYYVHAANFCYKLPDNVSLEEGALMEPLAVGVHACRCKRQTCKMRTILKCVQYHSNTSITQASSDELGCLLGRKC